MTHRTKVKIDISRETEVINVYEKPNTIFGTGWRPGQVNFGSQFYDFDVMHRPPSQPERK